MSQKTIQRKCSMCQKVYPIVVPIDGFVLWQAGHQMIQDAMPEVSAADRELLISGTCGPCFDHLFGEDA